MIPIKVKKDKASYAHITVDAEEVWYAKADRQGCILVFKNGSRYYYGYPLKKFEEKVSETCKFFRIHDSYLVRKTAMIDCCWLFAYLSNCPARVPISAQKFEEVQKIVEENLRKI